MTDCSTPKRAILAPLNANTLSPVSPMANLKLLTKVAAGVDEEPQEATNCYQIRIAGSEDDDDLSCSSFNLDGGTWTVEGVEGGGGGLVSSSRRFSSLKHIFREFLSLYPLQITEGAHKIMSIVQLSKQLRVQKRRVYDVINVVICLHMAFKVCKDRYQWHGTQHLNQALSLLKMYAIYRHLDSKLKAYTEREVDGKPIDESVPFEEKSFFEDNRIGALCQKFMMLMLVTEEGECLSLAVASKFILTSDIQFKTGMRRLYDIANALEALGLIVKSSRKDVGKPFFIYSGPKVEMSGVFSENLEKTRGFHGIHYKFVADPADRVNPRFTHDAEVPELSLNSSAQIGSSSGANERFVKITPKMSPFVRTEGFNLGEPPAKKRLSFSKSIEDFENPSLVLGTRQSITYIRSPFALKGFISTKPAIMVENERKKVYSERIRIQPSEPAVTVVDTATSSVSLTGLQDGGIYKAFKVGDSFQLVKL